MHAAAAAPALDAALHTSIQKKRRTHAISSDASMHRFSPRLIDACPRLIDAARVSSIHRRSLKAAQSERRRAAHLFISPT